MFVYICMRASACACVLFTLGEGVDEHKSEQKASYERGQVAPCDSERRRGPAQGARLRGHGEHGQWEVADDGADEHPKKNEGFDSEKFFRWSKAFE